MARSPDGSDDLAPCPDRSFSAVDYLLRRAQRGAAGRPDAAQILAQTISMACPGSADPYAVLGAYTQERQAEITSTLRQLLEDRITASRIPDGNDEMLAIRLSPTAMPRLTRQAIVIPVKPRRIIGRPPRNILQPHRAGFSAVSWGAVG
jgi:hypothetical protein